MISRRTVLGAVSAAVPLTLLPAAVAAGADRPLVALTFDDGPSPELTPTVLQTLRLKRVKATFFVQGRHARRHPDLLRRIRDDGHVIGNHSYDHPLFTDLTDAQARDEIVRTNDVVERITGTRPVLFRYPHGVETDAGNAVIREQGMWGGVGWHWVTGPGDYTCPGRRGAVDYVVANAADQALILLHDGNEAVQCGPQIRYLPTAIDQLRRHGFGFGVVDTADGPSPVNEWSWVRVVPA